MEEHGYGGPYRSVLRYVRAHYPPPKMRTYRRVETPPGAQSQTDWGEFPRVDLGRGSGADVSSTHLPRIGVVGSKPLR